jgi:hypothetical protein
VIRLLVFGFTPGAPHLAVFEMWVPESEKTCRFPKWETPYILLRQVGSSGLSYKLADSDAALVSRFLDEIRVAFSFLAE